MKTTVNNQPGGFPFQIDEFYLDLQEDGNKIAILSQEEISAKPFPGLRPFKTSEFQLFNGRIGQSEELIKRLKKNRFLAVIGSSGTGKSSLVRAGLIPQLFGGYLHEAGSKWNIAICRPGKDPIENLAIALSSIKSHTNTPEQLIDNFNEIEPMLSNSIYGLLEVKELLDANTTATKTEQPTSNLLVIIDQFEELFRFNRKDLGKDNIENQFVNLLLKAALDQAKSVYVIITMRSEFLGDCVKYRGLPEVINEGQYLVPQLTRNELKSVIENPIHLAGKKIAPNLVELLVNEIEESKLKENLDQLPILQHALMRTYNEAMLHGPDTEICYEHYKKIGEMEKALAIHVETKFNELGDADSNEKSLSKKQQIAKIIFQSLTELSLGQKSGRRPTELKNIYAIAAGISANEMEVNEVVNHFRDNDTSFIMPPINTILYPNLIIDISHESLMRNWEQLTIWMSEEMKFGNLYKQLNERRELHDNDPQEWLRSILLRELVSWKESYANNKSWAVRYSPLNKKTNDAPQIESLYKTNLAFLDNSIAENERVKEEKEKELQMDIAREQKIKSAKTRVRIYSLAVVVSMLFCLWAFSERNNAKTQEGIASANLKIADSLKKVAEISALVAKDSTVAAIAQRAIAEDQRKIAEEKTALANAQGIELAKYAAKAQMVAKEAIQQKARADTAKEGFAKQLVKNALKSEAFYFSSALDQATKEEIIDSLFNTPTFDTRQIQLAKYIDPNVLQLINEAVKAKENISTDPAKSLASAKKIWAANQHPLLKKLLLGIVNENIFSNDIIEAADFININAANLSIAKNNTGFAFNNDRQLVTGNTENGKLVINENSFAVPVDELFCGLKDNGDKNKNFAWLSYTDKNSVVAIMDSFSIKLTAKGAVDSITLIPGIKNYTAAQLSPDGKVLLLLDKDGNVSLKSTPASNEKIDTLVGNYRNKIYGNENMFFSPNSEYIFLNVEKKPRIINKKNKVTGMSDWGQENIATVSFTADSKQVIAVADGKLSVRDLSLSKLVGYQEIDLTTSSFVQASIIPDKINSLSLSQNQRKLLIGQKNGKVFLLEYRNGDSLFEKRTIGDEVIRIKKVGKKTNNTKASFINDSTIISISDDGTLSLSNIYADFDNPEVAIDAVNPKQSLRGKLENGQVMLNDLLATGSKSDLNTAAVYCYETEQIDSAKIIWQKLLDKAPLSMRVYYLGKLIDVNAELNNVDRINSSNNSSKKELKAIKEYRSHRVDRLKENVTFINEQVKLCANNSVYSENLSSTYGSLSFNQLFLDDFNGAIKSATTGIELSPKKNNWIYTNLALGYLLSGNFSKAEPIYRDLKDESFDNKMAWFKTAFLQDFNDLEDAGIFKRLSQKINDDIAKIKEMLSSSSTQIRRR